MTKANSILATLPRQACERSVEIKSHCIHGAMYYFRYRALGAAAHKRTLSAANISMPFTTST